MNHTHKTEFSRFPLIQAVSLFIAGSGIGWMTGLSVSPVASIVITSILGLGAGAVTGMQAMQGLGSQAVGETARRFDARPAAIFILGIALMIPCGILARTYHILEPGSAGDRQGSMVSVESSKQDQGVLFSEYSDDCDHTLALIAMKNNAGVIGLLKDSSIPGAATLGLEFQDSPEALARVLRIICTQYQPIE